MKRAGHLLRSLCFLLFKSDRMLTVLPGQVLVPEGHPTIARCFNVAQERPTRHESLRDG